MTKNVKVKTNTGLDIEVVKDFYSGLWNIRYCDNKMKFAGPYKTKREAVERLHELELK